MKFASLITSMQAYCDLSTEAKELITSLKKGILFEKFLHRYSTRTIREAQRWLVALTYASESMDSSFIEAQERQKRLHEYIREYRKV